MKNFNFRWIVILAVFLTVQLVGYGKNVADNRTPSVPQEISEEAEALEESSIGQVDSSPSTEADNNSASETLQSGEDSVDETDSNPLTEAEDSPVVERPQKDGFNTETATQLTLNSIVFSIPDYWQYSDSKSNDTTKYYYAETGDAVAFLYISIDSDQSYSQEDFDNQKEVISKSLVSEFQDGQIIILMSIKIYRHL